MLGVTYVKASEVIIQRHPAGLGSAPLAFNIDGELVCPKTDAVVYFTNTIVHLF